jgi:predicted ester cyclase
MSGEEHKSIVRRYLTELINEGRFEHASEILEPEYINHTAGGGIGTGRDAYILGLKALRTAFPDWHVEVQAMIAEGDVVCDRLLVTATHTGQGAGVPPTNEPMAGDVMHMWRIANGRLAEGWYFGTPDVMQRLFEAISPA